MDIIEILKSIGLSQQYLEYFKKDAYIMHPVLAQDDSKARIGFNVESILPATCYKEVKQKFESYIGIPVDIYVEAKNKEVSGDELNRYLDIYCEKTNNNPFKGHIPYINAKKEIVLVMDDQKKQKEIVGFLNQCGIDYPITNKDETIINDNVTHNIINTPTSNEYRRKRTLPKKEIDRSKYAKFEISKLNKGMKNIYISGKVFKVEYQTLRSKKELQKIFITDFNDAIMVKRFENNYLPYDELHAIKEGKYYTIYGSVNFDDFDHCLTLEADLIEEANEDDWIIKDEYQGLKHAELHVHTNKSEMDGVCEVGQLINQAYAFGQPAIGITDVGVVQAYPKTQEALMAIDKKDPNNNFKVIYGIEMKVADEQLKIVHNPTDQKVNEVEYCVFDLETTGLSTKYDHIIEFGGIIVKRNSVTPESPRLQMFIKPPVTIPPFIEQKTSITNEMVQNAPTLEQAIDQILDFMGDRVLVAHNADFDFNFINDKLVEMGREPLKNVCLDTLNLAKNLLQNRKYYRLGLIASNYGVEYDDDEAHRGDYDAEVLGNVLIRMLPTIKGYPNITFNDIQNNQDEQIYKKARTYNVTLLAKNRQGIRDIYELVSLSHTKYLTYFAKENAKKVDSDVIAEPRIIRSEIEKRRENLLIGSANMYSELYETAFDRSDKAVEECMKFYDYIQIQPINCYGPMMEEGSSADENRLEEIVRTLIRIADKQGKLVVGDNDVYYTYPYQKIARDVYIMAKRIGGSRHPLYPMKKDKRANFVSPNQHLMTTQEMLDAFDYLGSDLAKKIVIDNPLELIKDIDKLYPIPQELATPTIDGAEEELTRIIYENAHKYYGDPLPEIVEERIEKELKSVVDNGNTVQYYIAHLLVKQSNEDGYVVGSRGSVGSSFIATMAGITEVNPLVPHYRCPNCCHTEFFTNNEYVNGFDLPKKICPKCGTEMIGDGHNIPFETFLGFNGDKVPDIDLNFSPDYQLKAMLLIRDLFGEKYTYRAGTIGTVADKQAYGYIRAYCEEIGYVDSEGKPLMSDAYQDFLITLCVDVKRTTGQHAGGIVVIPKDRDVLDFTPVQYPANNPFADWLTTHFAFKDLHDNILKLDILGHVDPAAVKLLQDYTHVKTTDIPMNDPKALSIFSSTEALGIVDEDGIYTEKTGAAGLPEFGTANNRNILTKTRPTTFAELVALSGLTHGTNVWANNAEDLIDSGTCTLSEVIACRDDIMSYLISKNLDPKESFDIMESVRKGRGLKPNWIEDMQAHDVPDWYIESCQKIEYMFPKAHAVAYVTMAMRMAYCKVYYPAEFYAVYFSLRCDAYDIETMIKGKQAVYEALQEIKAKDRFKKTVKEKALESTFEIALEMYLRGYHFNNISLEKSNASNFIVDPDDDHGIIPSFTSVDGLGVSVANSIVEARNEYEFISKEDLQKRTQLSGTLIQVFERLGVLDGLSEENQLSLF